MLQITSRLITQVTIKNFKSVQELTLDLGRINVFIGENGSGKTSILEAIAFGSAASQDKLDEEFLVSRGIRVVEPRLMKSGFSALNSHLPVSIILGNHSGDMSKNDLTVLNGSWKSNLSDAEETEIVKFLKRWQPFISPKVKSDESVSESSLDTPTMTAMRAALSNLLTLMPQSLETTLSTFLLYAPENFFLRRFEEEGQIRPLGIRGEGLFKHLVDLSKESPELIAQISEYLKAIDWFEDFHIPGDLMFSERRINIVDKYLKDNITYFDQRSSNEGFLYLLFYYTLFLSKHTPKFFSIDNIDNALNPKLCIKLVQTLAQLAGENDKQAILTTHNPAVLDGLDLTDDNQRLFVIYRNADGHTTARRVPAPKTIPGVEPVRLSEAFVRGYLGGLPTNF